MIDAFYAGLRAHLTADPALIAALGGSAVYAGIAPANAAPPYVLMQWLGGGDLNTSAQPTADALISIQCVAGEGGQAGTVAALIRARLHEAALDLGADWQAYRCQHRGAFAYVELIDRLPFFHAGGQYRLRATQDEN